MVIPNQKNNTIQKALRFCILFFVVLLLASVALVGVQWFSDSVGNMFSHQLSSASQSFAASLEAGAFKVSADNFKFIDNKVRAGAALSMEFLGDTVFAQGYDATMGKIIFQKDAQKRLSIASLTKLMTALVVLQNYDVNQKTQISAAAIAQEGEQGSLKLGEALSVRNLLFIMLIESSNRAAYALSEITGPQNFVTAMNEKAVTLGMSNTHFEDSTGLGTGSYSTAEDLVKLSKYLFDTYPLFGEIINLKRYGLYVDGKFHHTLMTTNLLLGSNNIVGGKTGYTEEAKGCVMEIQKNEAGGYVIHIILGADDRFYEMQKLINFNQ